MVLKGATSLLPSLRYIKVEASDFACYKDNATVDEITLFLKKHHFKMVRKDVFARHSSGGQCFDLLYMRTSN